MFALRTYPLEGLLADYKLPQFVQAKVCQTFEGLQENVGSVERPQPSLAGPSFTQAG